MIMRLSSNNRGLTSRITTGGFTVLEALIGTAIFLVVALAGYNAFSVLMDAVSMSRAKIAATSVVNEQFEIIRNLPYEDVGLISGIPAGKIDRDQTVTRDGYVFEIEITIRNTDDPFDGIIGDSPADLSPADYKLVDLDLNCSNCKVFSPLSFTTIVAPHALETASTNGALFIRVFDAEGLPVTGALVHIENTQTNPDTIIDEITDNTGWLKIVDAPPGVNAYNISVTKSGYSQDQTYEIGGAAGAEPLLPDSTVVIQQVTQTSLSIDQTSTLNVSTIDATCVAVPSISFSLTGTKLIGLPDIKKYTTQNFSTDITGSYNITDLEWDSYSYAITNPLYDLAGGTLLPTFSLSPNESKNLNMVVVPHLSNALLVSVKDANNVTIDGATVHLQSGLFDETKTTNSSGCSTPGQTFWNGLAAGTYTMTVSKAGYQDSVSDVSVNTSWQNVDIILTP